MWSNGCAVDGSVIPIHVQPINHNIWLHFSFHSFMVAPKNVNWKTTILNIWELFFCHKGMTEGKLFLFKRVRSKMCIKQIYICYINREALQKHFVWQIDFIYNKREAVYRETRGWCAPFFIYVFLSRFFQARRPVEIKTIQKCNYI